MQSKCKILLSSKQQVINDTNIPLELQNGQMLLWKYKERWLLSYQTQKQMIVLAIWTWRVTIKSITLKKWQDLSMAQNEDTEKK